MRYIGVVIVKQFRKVDGPSHKVAVEAIARVSVKTPKVGKTGYDCKHETLSSGPSALISSLDHTPAGEELRHETFLGRLRLLCEKLRAIGFSAADVEEARQSANFVFKPFDQVPA